MARPRKKTATPNRVGAAVAALRREAGLTQQALAARAGLCRATVAALELGRYPHTATRTIEALAEALAVPPERMFQTHAEAALGANTTEALAAFLDSRWGSAVKPTEAELDWLARLPQSFFRGGLASPQAQAELLAWRRRHHGPPSEAATAGAPDTARRLRSRR
jgi:transcriptional regulator with XRE-family HTH domain